MKKILMSILLIIVIVIGGFFVAISMLKPETVQGEIAKIVQNITGKPLSVEQVPSISFMPLGVSFGAVAWGDKNADVNFAAKGGFVQVQFMPLLSGNIIIDEVRLDAPIIVVDTLKAAKNEKSSATSINDKQKNDKPAAQGDALPALPVELSKLQINDGQVLIHLSKTQKISLKQLNTTLSNLKTGATSTLKLETILDIAEPNLEGSLSLDAHVNYANDGININKISVLYTPKAGLIPANMGKIDVTGESLSVVLGKIPSIKGLVNIKELKLDALMAEDTKGAKGAAKQSSNVTNNQKKKQSASRTMYPHLDVALKIQKASFKGLEVRDIFIQAKGSGGAKASYDLNPIKLNLVSGGNINAKANIQLPSMRVQKEGTLTGLKLAPILKALQGKDSLDAMVDMNWNLTLVAKNKARIMKTLSGNGKVQAKDIILTEGISIPKNPIIKSENFKEFSELTVPFKAKNGHVSINNAKLVGKSASATAEGKVILPTEKLDLKVDATLLKMTVPLVIGGTFNKPSYGVEPAWLKKSLLRIPAILMQGGAKGEKGKEAGKEAGKGLTNVEKGAEKLIRGLFGN